MALISTCPNHTDAYLILGFCNAPIFHRHEANPLAIPLIRIQQHQSVSSDGSDSLTVQAQPPASAWDQVIARVGRCLQCLLKREYGNTDDMLDNPKPQEIMKTQNPRLAHIDSPLTALNLLKSELRLYAEGREPFERNL